MKTTLSPIRVAFRSRRRVLQTLPLVALASSVNWAVLPPSARAAIQTYDTSATAGQQGANGTWDAGITPVWNPAGDTAGTTLTTWTNGNDADFRGGNGYTVTVSGTVAANSILNTAANGTQVTFAGTNAGAIQLGAGGLNVQNGGSGLSFGATLALQVTASQVWQPGNNSGILVSSNITEAGAGGYTLTEQSSGFGGKQVTLSGTNTFTNFTMNDTGGQFLNTPNYQLIISANSTTLTGNLNLQAGNQGTATSNYDAIVIGNSATPATLSANTVTKTGTGFTQIQLGQAGNFIVGAGGGTSTIASPIVNQGSSTTGTLTKAGSGVLTLTGANTYGGGTIVNGGTLLVNNTSGSGVGTGAVAVNNTGILGGGAGAGNGGTLNAATAGATLGTFAPNAVGILTATVNVNSGATLAPGNSVGTLTLGSLTLAAGSLLTYEFSATANDFTAVTGALTLGGGRFTLLQENTATAFAAAGTYNLFSYGTTLAGNPAALLTVANADPGFSYNFRDNGAGLVQLTISAVPEPGTWAMMVGGGLLLVGLQSRRRRLA